MIMTNPLQKAVSNLGAVMRYKNAKKKIDDPAIYDGAAVALQLVGRRLQEEKVLALTEYLGNAIWASK